MVKDLIFFPAIIYIKLYVIKLYNRYQKTYVFERKVNMDQLQYKFYKVHGILARPFLRVFLYKYIKMIRDVRLNRSVCEIWIFWFKVMMT